MRISDIPKDLLDIMTGKDELSSMIIVSRSDALIFNQVKKDHFCDINSAQMFKLMLEEYIFQNDIEVQDVRASETISPGTITERPGATPINSKDIVG
jgi:hypothetical protein